MGKQTFGIPENCNATVEQVGNQIVISFEPKNIKFKNGDIVSFSDNNDKGTGYIIFDRSDYQSIFYHAMLTRSGKIIHYGGMMTPLWDTLRLATPKQRQLLFDKLKGKGYRFNEETCELEKIKWEPDYGEKYEFINSHGVIIATYNVSFKTGTLNQEKVSRLFAEFIQEVKDDHGIDY